MNDEQVYEIFSSNLTDTLQYIDLITLPDYCRYLICAVDINNGMGQIQYHTVEWLGGPIEGMVILESDTTPITGPAVIASLQNLGYFKPVYVAENTSRYPLEAALDAVFVNLGIYPNNHVLGNEEAQVLRDYPEMGVNIYMEGSDTWYYDDQTVLHPMFNILPVADGSGDLIAIIGSNGTFTDGMSFSYNGENSRIDHIDPILPAFTIFSNYSPAYNCAVAYNPGVYRTIGASFELGGLVDQSFPSRKNKLINEILNFFNVIIPVEMISFTAGVDEQSIILRWSTATELNNQGFEIERSGIDRNFYSIGFIAGKGTITEKQDYSSTDNTVVRGNKYFYRLKQIEYDGTLYYWDIVEVDYNLLPVNFSQSQNYPNPFNPSTKIKFTVPAFPQSSLSAGRQGQKEGTIVTLKVFDIPGNEIAVLINEERAAGTMK